MGEIRLETNGENMTAVSMAFFQSATIILHEFAKLHGNGPWFNQLKEEIKKSMKNAIPEGIPAEKEAEFIKAGLDAVDLVFDRVKFA